MMLSDDDYKRYIKYVDKMMSGKKLSKEEYGEGYPTMGEDDEDGDKSYSHMKHMIKSDVMVMKQYNDIMKNPMREKAAKKCAAYKAYEMNKIAK